MTDFRKIYINGKWIKPKGKKMVDVINPSTEAVIATTAMGNETDVDLAVKAATDAFEDWAGLPPAERADYIQKIADAMAENQDALGEMIAKEVGMPVMLSKLVQAGFGIETFKNYATIAREYQYEAQQGTTQIIREPIGVCGFITPWNFPLYQIAGKVAPALAAGCTMILKPSQEAPLNAFLLTEIIDKVGLPKGVFNLISGAGSVVGQSLASHPGVDMVSITGSTSAGIRVAQAGAETVKRVTQELGGKSANIMLDDTDFEAAVGGGVFGCFLNSGQTCSALTRMLVPASKQDEVIEAAKAAAAGSVVGDPFAETTTMGPVISAEQQRIVTDYIQKGIDEGATLVTGGIDRPEGIEKGYFVQPTIFADVKPEMTIAREEIFGPVLCIMPFKDDDDAVRIANDSIYGLSGGVWSADIERAKKVARRLRTGEVFLNGAGIDLDAPFGGYKQSGNGREFGHIGLEEFLEVKSIMGYHL